MWQGMDVMRINFSHATYEEAAARVHNVRKARGLTRRRAKGMDVNTRAVLLDTQGPEIRTGVVKKEGGVGVGDDGKIALKSGQEVWLTSEESERDNCDGTQIFTTYAGMSKRLQKGGTVLLDDGAVELRVTSDTGGEEDGRVRCEVMNSGKLGSRKGV